MSEHLRALVVILAIAVPVFWLAQRALCPAVMTEADFVRRRNMWLGITLAAFLSHNYWLYLAIASAVVLWGAHQERNPMALFFFLLFAIPSFAGSLPGLGMIQHFFEVNHTRFLVLLVLLPAALRLAMSGTTLRLGRHSADWFMLAYLALLGGSYLLVASLTQVMRGNFYLFVDIFLIYYVASRSLRDLSAFKDTAASLGVALLVVAPIAAFEFGKHWLLYSSLNTALGLSWDGGAYLGREALLRAVGPAGHSIALGYAFAVGLGMWACLQRRVKPAAWWVGALTLVIGLIAPVSRGPWVGAALIVAIVVGIGPNAGPRIAKLFVAGCVLGGVLLLSPYGEKLIDYLPFVGTVDEGSVTYRSQLFTVSMLVISQNPWFGSYDFLANPVMEQMRQGQGIIDLVNSYIAVALSSGIAGLTLFTGCFVVALRSVFGAMRQAGADAPDAELLGRALLGTLAGVMVMIATVSSILAIPTLYWSLVGMAAAYAAMVRRGTAAVATNDHAPAKVHRTAPVYFSGSNGRSN